MDKEAEAWEGFAVVNMPDRDQDELERLRRRNAEFERQLADAPEMKLIDGMLNGFALHDIICDADENPVDYRFVYVNPAFERMVGLGADRVIGRTVLDTMPGTEPHWIASYGRVALGGEPAHFEGYAGVLGRYFEVWAYCPGPGRFVTVFTDTTERRLIVERLGLTQYSVDSSPDAVFWIMPDARFSYVNKRASEVLGYTRQELLELTVHDIDPQFPPEGWPAHWARVKKLGSIVLTSVHRRKDGSTFPVEIASSRVEFDGMEYSCAFARDITERQRVNEIMARASRLEATATLAGGIAHQFNNLLVSVLGNAEMLKLDAMIDPAAAVLVDDIMTSGVRAMELAGQMLAFARGGKYVVETMSLNQAIEETCAAKKDTLPAGVSVERDLAPDLWPVQADRSQMAQILASLCINAVEAMEGEGSVVITTRNVELEADFTRDREPLAPGPHIHLSVVDSGHGISSEALDRIFEPFFTTRAPGRGLGLAAVHGIINNHRGYIAASSEPGRGATLELYLPAAAARSRRRPPTTSMPQGEGVVLLVDDDVMVVKASRRMLDRMGYTVLIARNGEEAVDLAGEHAASIRVVLLDMKMPTMSGSETYPLLRQLLPDARILICTGFDLDAASRALIEQGADGFIQKPFDLRTLGEALQGASEDGDTSEP